MRKELTKPTAADVGAFCYQWIATHKGYFSITSAADRKMEKEYGPDQTYPLYLDAAKRFRVSAEKARGAADNGHKRHSKAEALQAKIQEFCYDLYHVGQKSKPTTALIRWGVTEDQRKRLVKLKISRAMFYGSNAIPPLLKLDNQAFDEGGLSRFRFSDYGNYRHHLLLLAPV